MELALVSLLPPLLLRPQLESVSSTSPCKTHTREGEEPAAAELGARSAGSTFTSSCRSMGTDWLFFSWSGGKSTTKAGGCHGVNEAEKRINRFFLLTLTDASALHGRVLPSFIS